MAPTEKTLTNDDVRPDRRGPIKGRVVRTQGERGTMATMVEASEATKDEQVVVFRLEAERYGIDIFRVNEIVRLREITPIPRTAAHVRGLINLRGRTIPVVDLRARFGISGDACTEKARIIVVEAEDGQVGLVVDEVCEVSAIAGTSIEPPPSLLGGIGDCVRGIARREDRLVALLDLDRTLES